MSRLRDERGLTLIELLVGMIITTAVLGATFTTFIAMTHTRDRTEDQVRAEDTARTTMDRIAREMRNLASPGSELTTTSAKPLAIWRDEPFDFIFKSVRDAPTGPATDANVQRVRYCLDATTPANGRLYRIEEPLATENPVGAACPGSNAGWSAPRIVASNLVNRINGQTRPVFGYVGAGADITATDAASRELIDRVRVFLYVDTTPNTKSVETPLWSSVMLRNQNRYPTADMDVKVTDAAARKVLLNGSASEDPEGQTLTYKWYLDGGTTPIGEGVVFSYTVPTAGAHTFKLVVSDPAGLAAQDTDTRGY